MTNGQALDGLRVLDLATDRGHLCGKLLADLGAEVLKIEPPQGDASRLRPPFAEHVADRREASLVFHHFNTNKRSVVIDLASSEGQLRFKALVKTADVVIESFDVGQMAEWGLGFLDLKSVNPNIVLCSITGFGQWGPHAKYAVEDAVVFAMGGIMSICGDADKEPLAIPYDFCFQLASVYGAFGILLALLARGRTGAGQHVDISAQEVLAFQQWMVVNYSAVENILGRAGSRSARSGSAPHGPYPCKDGYVEFFILSPSHWRDLYEWMGKPEVFSDPMWENRHFRAANVDVLIPFVLELAARYTKQEIFEEAAKRHIPIVPVNKPEDYLADQQIQFRRFLQSVEHPILGSYQSLGFPYRLNRTPCALNRPAPLLGQHTEEVLEGNSRTAVAKPSWPSNMVCPPGQLPLQGFRVLDLGMAVAGPALSYLLAQAGADVIRIESSAREQRGSLTHADARTILQRVVAYEDYDRLKRQCTINLGSEEGRAVFLDLVRTSDVVVENFSPRVMRRWKLDYENLKAVRPDIIMVSLPAFGLEGPRVDYIGAASTTQAFTGLYNWWSYWGDPEPAAPTGAISDYVAAGMAATALSAALIHRQCTGQGQHIEVPQVEALATLMGPAYLNYTVNGKPDPPQGNRASHLAPQGCYQCKGLDEWCVISVRTDAQWQSLCQVLDASEMGQDPRFATLEGRAEHHDELDAKISAWTKEHTSVQVMRMLQRVGVPAGVVQNGERLLYDIHLRQRNYFVEINHPSTGFVEYPGAVIHLSETPLLQGPWYGMGHHNIDIFEGLLGMSNELFRELEIRGPLA